MLKRLLIILAIAISFGRLGFHEFTGWDDPGTIHQNPDFHPPTLRSIAKYWTAFGERAPFGLYIPLTYTVWGGLAKVALLDTPDEMGIRLNPYVFHLANVVLHIAAALVVFEILRLLVRNDWAAVAGAMLWGLHPTQVEAVGWASGTKDVLCGLLSFVALWQYVRHVRLEERRLGFHYILATIALVAAMLAKPTAIVVPLIALTLDRFGLDRPMKRSMIELLPWFVLIIPCIIWTKLAQTTPEVAPPPLALRPLIAADALAFYLYKLVWPVNLGIDYGRFPARAIERGWIWYAWIVPAGVAVAMWLVHKRAPLLVAGALVFAIALLPVLGFVPFQFQVYSTVTDHYLYIPMLGVALAAAWSLTRLPRRAAVAASTIVLLALGILSFRQGACWRDDITLFRRAVAVNPNSFVGHNNLGANLLYHQQFADAERHLRRAIELFPEYGTAHDNLADLLVRTGRREEAIELQRDLAHRLKAASRPAEAEQHLESALQIETQKQ